MIQNAEPFVRFGKANLETALTVADITLESTERLVALQMKTAKAALARGMRHVEALADVTNVRDFVALQSKVAQPDLDKALAFSRDVYAVATDAQERIGKILKSRLSELGGEIVTAVDQAAKSTPATDTALAALQASAGAGNGDHRRARAAGRAGKSVASRRTRGKRKTARK